LRKTFALARASARGSTLFESPVAAPPDWPDGVAAGDEGPVGLNKRSDALFDEVEKLPENTEGSSEKAGLVATRVAEGGPITNLPAAFDMLLPAERYKFESPAAMEAEPGDEPAWTPERNQALFSFTWFGVSAGLDETGQLPSAAWVHDCVCVGSVGLNPDGSVAFGTLLPT
jgi:hypothetical protein